MNRTLPLFQGLEFEGLEVESPNAPRPPAAQPERLPAAAPSARPASRPAAAGGDRHLRAAWRLSRGMWRHPDHSPEQTKAGLAICRHLQALLAETQSGGGAGQR